MGLPLLQRPRGGLAPLMLRPTTFAGAHKSLQPLTTEWHAIALFGIISMEPRLGRAVSMMSHGMILLAKHAVTNAASGARAAAKPPAAATAAPEVQPAEVPSPPSLELLHAPNLGGRHCRRSTDAPDGGLKDLHAGE
jgi:hypothetical protein